MQGAYYQPVDAVKFDHSEEEGHSYRSSNRLRQFLNGYLKSPLIILNSILVLLLGLLVGIISWNYIDKVRVSTCGQTPDEARAKGCLFESHNFAWTPPECYDKELNAKWDSKNWGYSRNAEGTDMISQEEILLGEHKWAYVTLNQHLSHCILIWQKYQRAVMFQRPADNWTASFAHTYHCGHMLVQWGLNHSAYDSILYTKYVSCDYSWKSPDFRMFSAMNGPVDGGLVGDDGNHADSMSGKTPIDPGHENEHSIQQL
ncbi:hypothetical protein HBI56_017870 [Parastagonospora nodorum]|uniref:Uncharacterized protein n=2 Tax=Phaeosphaeria nodorum (strain SN15 / ATCC MYA-4574 / FGSC 10173) TaxID=321614 RepID=Q0V376_PHANO|nr:hypothetical protein SNOG_01538 [Parastagonospora nodorum SN15]KAH3914929.1 hypothetical protein HBH56_082140 [Parastagonospora nodorum]EAT91187.1 hypothetical protein SNOG_01538 [Parastagonospora nodorum SN15]KAH3929929.1 hypothetical protein HBH54_119700 [Parastagonospora nodorum]KAH3955800.1 hypothetical protein HBH53_004870 [Parastagonospora nodorum]KAH3976707.1 hypothetical protein HBH51_076670 [Parastagonospora nodorum]